MKIAAIIVNYFSVDYVAMAVASLVSEFKSVDCDNEIVVVDNGCHFEDRQAFARMPIKLVRPDLNCGYSGGLNAGIKHVDADFFLLMNADVELLPDSLHALMEALKNGADIAGPRFFWDKQCQWILPPTERRDLLSLALDKFSAKSKLAGDLALQRWRKHAWRHWDAKQNIESYSLSGALLAVSRKALLENGLFDEAYQLYFEETDWLERARKKRLKSVYVPGSRVRHYYNRSAVQQASSESWFQQSQKRFEQSQFGVAASLIERCASIFVDRSFSGVAYELLDDRKRKIADVGVSSQDQGLLVEVSPRVCGYPAARHEIASEGSWSLAAECWDSQPQVSFYVRLLGKDRRELPSARIVPDLHEVYSSEVFSP